MFSHLSMRHWVCTPKNLKKSPQLLPPSSSSSSAYTILRSSLCASPVVILVDSRNSCWQSHWGLLCKRDPHKNRTLLKSDPHKQDSFEKTPTKKWRGHWKSQWVSLCKRGPIKKSALFQKRPTKSGLFLQKSQCSVVILREKSGDKGDELMLFYRPRPVSVHRIQERVDTAQIFSKVRSVVKLHGQ